MLVGFMEIELYLPWSDSLKTKRSEIKSITDKTSAKFRVSVAESGGNELLQSGKIAIAFLAHNKILGDRVMDSMLNYIENIAESEVVKVDREYR